MGIGHVGNILEAGIEWEGASQKLLAVVVAYHADRRGICRLTQGELGEAVMIGRRRVADLLDGLCILGVLQRLQHGRYGLRYGLPVDEDSQRLPQPKGAREEELRLRALRQPHQYIAYRRDGWPVLENENEFNDSPGS